MKIKLYPTNSPPEHELVALKYPVTTCHLENNSDKTSPKTAKMIFDLFLRLSTVPPSRQQSPYYGMLTQDPPIAGKTLK